MENDEPPPRSRGPPGMAGMEGDQHRRGAVDGTGRLSPELVAAGSTGFGNG